MIDNENISVLQCFALPLRGTMDWIGLGRNTRGHCGLDWIGLGESASGLDLAKWTHACPPLIQGRINHSAKRAMAQLSAVCLC